MAFLKNRSLQFQARIINDKDHPQPAIPQSHSQPEVLFDPENIVAAATDLGMKAVKGAAILMVTYMAADTLRQVIVKSTITR